MILSAGNILLLKKDRIVFSSNEGRYEIETKRNGIFFILEIKTLTHVVCAKAIYFHKELKEDFIHCYFYEILNDFKINKYFDML